MVGNKQRDTKPELRVRKALWAAGLRGYRIDYKGAPGKPDIAYVGKKVAVMVYGCYWHRCPHCQLPNPKTNTAWWTTKFVRNQERDARKKNQLEDAGWRVVEIWECKTKKAIDDCVTQVRYALDESACKKDCN